MRKLATIQVIEGLNPIEGADAIELARVLGWNVVVKKGEFKTGDYCVYFEIDSLLPVRPEFEFLAKGGTKKMLIDGKEVEGYRLKTIRLRGQISQGLALPLTILPESYVDEISNNGIEFQGLDVSSILDIHKYEPPIPASLSGVAKGFFPGFIPKTDETRIQAYPNVLARNRDLKYYVTEKIDGTSMTVYWKDGELNVCGRNINLKETPESTYWKVARALKLEEKLKGSPIVIQGELYGEGIQKNKLKIKGQRLAVYNVYDMESKAYLGYEEFVKVCNKFGLETVPVLDENYQIPAMVEPLVQYATQKSVINPNTWLEGVVIRPLVETQDEDLGRLSFKVVNPEFLLEYGE